MPTILLLIIVLVWLVGTSIRIYKQARFYQIEEYMSQRYLRWLWDERGRWLPKRPIIAWFIGTALGVFLGEAPDSVLPHLLGIIFGIIAIIPPDEGEIKKAFVRTQRATRLLAAAILGAIVALIILLLVTTTLPLPDVDALQVGIVGLVGLLVYLFAPLWLVVGNILMTPVEAFLRQRFMNQAKSVLDDIRPVIVGITGSYGKTTTKNFLRDILSVRYRTYATPKSYNTLMGICLAINHDLADDYSIEYFISEMGAYVPGEIERICDLTPPHIGIVTEVGPQHLERFGSLENTAQAKYELIKELPPDGVGIFNWDNPYVREMYEQGYPATCIAVSKDLSIDDASKCGVRYIAKHVHEIPEGLSFDVVDVETETQETFQTPVLGEHNVTNLLLVTAAAVHEGLSLRDIAIRVRTLKPAESRLVQQTTAQGITIINDAYSANPIGARNALKVLGMHTSGKRLLITPGMIELGDIQEEENYKLGQVASHYATDIILVGKKQTDPLRKGILETDFASNNLQVVETLAEAVSWYQQHLRSGDTVLFLNDLPDTY